MKQWDSYCNLIIIFAIVKERLAIQNIYSVLSVLGLLVLLLLSPCKVRNFIQTELGVPKTKVLNKSQSALSQSNCQTLDLSEAIQTYAKPTIQQPDFPPTDAVKCGFIIDAHKQFFTQRNSESHLILNVPLYILYQNFQIYS